jgi:hypothetical protein
MVNKFKHLILYTVFTILCNVNRSIHSVIESLIIATIHNNSLYEFNAKDIINSLKETFDFLFKEAVIENSLNRLTKSNILTTTDNIEYILLSGNKNDISDEFEKAQTINNEIIDDLTIDILIKKNIITNKKIKELKDIPEAIKIREEVIEALYEYLLNENNTDSENEYFYYISLYVKKLRRDKKFKDNITRLKEGLIVYLGFKYDFKINNWDKPLIFYLNMEILFSLGGYNGKIHKDLVDEFFSLIDEINKGKSTIELKYFEETKNEIDKFFEMAKKIVKMEDHIPPGTQAMVKIINGCKEVSDIILKKTEFYNLLEKKDIKLAEKISLNVKLTKNKKFSKKLSKNGLKHYSKIFNYITYCRRNSICDSIENSSAILVTNNNKLLEFTEKNLIKEETIPLAKSLNSLTNILWFELDKGFNDDGNYPKSLDIVSKSMVVFSDYINGKIQKEYDKMQGKNLDKPEIISYIAELRKQSKQLEDGDNKQENDVSESEILKNLESNKKRDQYIKILKIFISICLSITIILTIMQLMPNKNELIKSISAMLAGVVTIITILTNGIRIWNFFKTVITKLKKFFKQ